MILNKKLWNQIQKVFFFLSLELFHVLKIWTKQEI